MNIVAGALYVKLYARRNVSDQLGLTPVKYSLHSELRHPACVHTPAGSGSVVAHIHHGKLPPPPSPLQSPLLRFGTELSFRAVVSRFTSVLSLGQSFRWFCNNLEAPSRNLFGSSSRQLCWVEDLRLYLQGKWRLGEK